MSGGAGRTSSGYTPSGIRTRATTLKGWRPRPLVDGGSQARIAVSSFEAANRSPSDARGTELNSKLQQSGTPFGVSFPPPLHRPGLSALEGSVPGGTRNREGMSRYVCVAGKTRQESVPVQGGQRTDPRGHGRVQHRAE